MSILEMELTVQFGGEKKRQERWWCSESLEALPVTLHTQHFFCFSFTVWLGFNTKATLLNSQNVQILTSPFITRILNISKWFFKVTYGKFRRSFHIWVGNEACFSTVMASASRLQCQWTLCALFCSILCA